MEKVLPEILEIPLPEKGWFIERAHRLGPRVTEDRRSGRTLIARFIRLGDRDSLLQVSQEKGDLRWNGKRVMIFPDFSRDTVAKRDTFRECKRVLNQCGVKFALQYLAMLCVHTKEGSRRFDNPKAAMNFIRSELSQVAGDMEQFGTFPLRLCGN